MQILAILHLRLNLVFVEEMKNIPDVPTYTLVTQSCQVLLWNAKRKSFMLDAVPNTRQERGQVGNSIGLLVGVVFLPRVCPLRLTRPRRLIWNPLSLENHPMIKAASVVWWIAQEHGQALDPHHGKESGALYSFCFSDHGDGKASSAGLHPVVTVNDRGAVAVVVIRRNTTQKGCQLFWNDFSGDFRWSAPNHRGSLCKDS